MISIENQAESFNSFVDEWREKVKEGVSRAIEEQLEREVEGWLYRGWHGRRARVGRRQTQAKCGRCGTRQAGRFSRNGHRRRQLVTSYGVVTIW